MKRNIHAKPLCSIHDTLFEDEKPDPGNVAERGYATEAEMADDERVQRSRAAQTFFINDHRDGEHF